MPEFDGILNSTGHIHQYDPSKGFNMDDLNKMFLDMDSLKRTTPMQIIMGGYGMAIWNNDTEQIAHYQRENRKDNVRKWRTLVARYGIDLAKVIDWFDKYDNGFRGCGYSGNTWTSSPSSFAWGDYGRSRNDYDDSYASLRVTMIGDRFEIKITGNDGHGYDYKEKILSASASYKSVINQINYFLKKYTK